MAGCVLSTITNVRSLSLPRIDNALPGRDGYEVEIFGMEGIPAPDVADYKRRKEIELGLAAGSISQPQAKRPKIENRVLGEEELKAQLQAHKALMGANDTSVPPPADGSSGGVYGAGPQTYAAPPAPVAMPPPGMAHPAMPPGAPPFFPPGPPPPGAFPGQPPFPPFGVPGFPPGFAPFLVYVKPTTDLVVYSPPPPGFIPPPGFLPPPGMIPPGAPPFPVGGPRPPFPLPQFVPAGASPPIPPPLAGSPMPPTSNSPPAPAISPQPPVPPTPNPVPPISSSSSQPQGQLVLPNPALKQTNPDVKKKMVLKYQDANFSPVCSLSLRYAVVILIRYRMRNALVMPSTMSSRDQKGLAAQNALELRTCFEDAWYEVFPPFCYNSIQAGFSYYVLRSVI